jgi:hypothetical protein
MPGLSFALLQAPTRATDRSRASSKRWLRRPVRFKNHIAHRTELISRHYLGRLGVISHRSAQEAIGPLLGELTRAGKDHWHLGVADSQPAQHVRQPGTAAGLGSEQVRVVRFDHNRRLGELGQALQLEGEAAVGE